MSRVLTFSRSYPKKHSKEGEPTFFVEKIWSGIGLDSKYYDALPDARDNFFELNDDLSHRFDHCAKWTTIRAGRRWNAGDWFSPRVWGEDINPKNGKSGPYQSKQIIFAPDIQLKSVWDIEIDFRRFDLQIPVKENEWVLLSVGEVAENDGLDVHDFIEWFKLHPKKGKQKFIGQILCWSDQINYSEHGKH